MAKNKLKNKTPKYEYGELFFDEEKYTYSMFFKQYIWVHIVLISLLAISVFFTLAINSNWFRQCENWRIADCWNNIISYTVSYIGTIFLGLIVFFNTCQRQYFDDREANLKVKITARPNNLNPLKFYSAENIERLTPKCSGGSNSANKKLAYIKFNITNYNYKFPMFVESFKAFYADDKENICEIKDYEFASQTDNFMPLDFKEEKNIYIGIDENYFEKLPQNIAYVFKCSNVKDVSKYYVYFMFFHKDMYERHIESMKAKDYEKAISKHKQPLEKWKFYLTLGKEKNKTCDESNY